MRRYYAVYKKTMKPAQRLPTIIALLFLTVIIGSTVFMIENAQDLLVRADIDTQPKNILITNVSDSTFSVSWTTDKPTRGSLSYRKESDNQRSAFDDQDATSVEKHTNHHITIRDLTGSTTYFFTILSENKTYDSNGSAYQVKTTGPLAQGVVFPPVYGLIITSNNEPAEGALVYLSIPGSQTLSTITQTDGRFVIPISGLRNENLTSLAILAPTTEIDLALYGANGTKSSIQTLLNNTTPLPTITVGKNYDLRNSQSLIHSVVAIVTKFIAEMKPNLFTPVYAATTISISQPTEGAGIPSTLPQFKGTGVPYKELLVTVGVPPQVGKLTINKEGLWAWAPPQPLQPDTYVLTITTYNELNQPVALARQFTILKSGSGVLQAATPSATPKASATPSATPTASPSANPVPVSGTITPTLILLASGLLFLFIGTLTFVL